jgi:hypothetical protein
MAKILNPYSQVNTNVGGVDYTKMGMFQDISGSATLPPSVDPTSPIDPTQVVVNPSANLAMNLNNDANALVNNAINPQINPYA